MAYIQSWCHICRDRFGLRDVDGDDGRTAHTYKSTVLSEAEEKPNFHRRTKGVKVNSEPEPIPMPMSANPTVLTNNGKSSGEDRG